MTRALCLASMLAALAAPFAANAQSALPETRIVAGGQLLPPNGSEGGLQSEASLPPGALDGTDAVVTAGIVNAYLKAQSMRTASAVAAR